MAQIEAGRSYEHAKKVTATQERQMRAILHDLVLVDCEIKTETCDRQMVIQDGRVCWLPRDWIHEKIFDPKDKRADGGWNGTVLIARTLAENHHLSYRKVPT